jgi:KDO2-lipid IV(A) lauroyltransferase
VKGASTSRAAPLAASHGPTSGAPPGAARGTSPGAARGAPQGASPAASRGGLSSLWGMIRRASAAFWLQFMFFWGEHYPPFVLWSRPFFLWFAWRYSTVLRGGTLANARWLLGPGSTMEERVAFGKRVLTNFYLSIYEIAESCRMTREQLVRHVDAIEGTERYLAARREGKGAILVTAHLGSFELGAAALRDQEPRVHVLFRRDEFPRFERLRSRMHRVLGVVEVPFDEGWSAWARLRDALAADEVVMIQGDRVMPGHRGAEVPFLSGHIRLPLGPIKLAQATGAPIIPVFSIRTGVHRVRVIIDEPIHVDPAVPAHRSGEVHPALRKVASAIERQVAAHPDQWIMVEPVWCEDIQDAH